MAHLNYILLILAVLNLSFVENAPSNIMRSNLKDEELRTRLVFIDTDADDAVNSNSQTSTHVLSSSSLYPTQNSGLKKSTRSSSNQDVPTLKVKAPETSSLSGMDDERQIWGIAVENKDIIEDESFYNRPLALPKNLIKPPNQRKNHVVTEELTVTSAPKPSDCDTAIVICCNNSSKLKECFSSRGCSNATEDMFTNLCSSDSINRVIKDFGKYYKATEK